MNDIFIIINQFKNLFYYLSYLVIDILFSILNNTISILNIINFLLGSYNFILITILIITIFFVVGEILSIYRYYYFLDMMKKKEAKFDLTLKNDEIISKYLNHVKKHLINDKFSDIFNCYYPNQTMTKEKIKSTIKYYLFGFDYDHIKIPINMINTHKSINQLVRIISKRYVLIDDGKNEKNKYLDQTNFNYKYFTNYLYDMVRYYSFKNDIIKNDFEILEYDSLRIYKYKHKKKPKMLYFVSDIDEIDFNRTYFYVELKSLNNNLLNYSVPDTNHILNELRNVLKTCVNGKFSIEINNYLTFLLPKLIDYFDENIESIFLINPICYPYSYHKPMSNIKSNLSYEMIYCLHNLSLLHMLTCNFDTDILLNKDLNKLYSHKTHIIINSDIINSDVLIPNLILYSNIDIDNTD